MAEATPRKSTKAESPAPSRLMRIPADAYETIRLWAERHRRHMNQELAHIVEDWDRQERAKLAAEERKQAAQAQKTA